MAKDEEVSFLQSRPREELEFLGVLELEPTIADKDKTSFVVADNELYNQEQTNWANATKSFPLEIFPKVLNEFICEVTEAMQCPVDFIAIPLLACAGTAIGTSREVQIKEGWREGPRIYCAIVADPGSKKTPATNKGLQPLHGLQERIIQKYKETLAEYEAADKKYEVELENWKKDTKQKYNQYSDPPRKPEKPVMKQIITSDATWEALSELMENNPRGVLFHRDELTGWVKGMDQYRKGADRQNWLSVWSGESIIINRKGTRFNIPKPLVNVVGGIQPDVLDELIDRGKEDGFVDRILFSYPDPILSYWTDKGISEQVTDNYRRIIYSLFALKPQEENEPKVIYLDREAKIRFKEWYDEMQLEVNDPGFPVSLKGAWSKFIGYCCRLSLIIHCLRYVCNEATGEDIDVLSMSLTIQLMEYFKNHTRKVYTLLKGGDGDKRVRHAIDYIKQKGNKGEINIRDFQRSNACGVKTKEDTLELFKLMESQGYGKIEERKNQAGRTSTFFKLAN